MKLETNNQSTILSSAGVQTTSAFNIARTPHMFTILSSGLYSDKISAVLREIGCNAVDAHIMHGCAQRPIEVKLPSVLDRSFYVKDWGPGLDDREVTELYTTYGYSSKQDNDDVTGAFGLGSKSPFAYTLENKEDADGFTVEAVKNGVKRIYTCHITDAGAPAISRLYEGPADADWTSGVKVSFAVQSQHISEFHEKAASVYKWFSVLPDIRGLNVPLAKPQCRLEHEYFMLPSGDTSTPGVVMGNVFYPISAVGLRDVTDTEMALLKSGIILKAPIGTVMMTPSREGLEYTERTRKGLHQYLQMAVKSIAKSICDAIATPAENNWKWYQSIQRYYSTLPATIRLFLSGFLSEGGMSAEEAKRVLNICDKTVASLPVWVGNRRSWIDEGTPVQVLYYSWGPNGDTVRRREVSHGGTYAGDKHEPLGFHFLNKVAIFYGDCKCLDKRMRLAIREEGYTAVLLVAAESPQDAQKYALRIVTDGAIQGIPFMGASAISLPVLSDEEKRARRAARQNAAEAVKHMQARVYDLKTGTFKALQMQDLTEKQHFYIFEICSGRRGRRISYENKQGHRHLKLSGESNSSISVLTTMAEQLPAFMDGIVVLTKRKELKELRLEDLGFEPALFAIEEQIAKPEVWADLVQNVGTKMNLDVRNLYSMGTLGAFGILAYHLRNETDFGKVLALTYSGTAAYADMMEFSAKGENPCRKLAALRLFQARVPELVLKGNVTPRTVETVNQEFGKKYPSLRYLDKTSIYQPDEASWADLLQMLKPVFMPAKKVPQLALAA